MTTQLKIEWPPELLRTIAELKAGALQAAWWNGALTGGLVVAVALIALMLIFRGDKK